MSKQIYKDKFYTHFDKKKYHTNYEQSVQNINWVSRHGFYPFIRFQMDCSKYTNDLEGKVKFYFISEHLPDNSDKFAGAMPKCIVVRPAFSPLGIVISLEGCVVSNNIPTEIMLHIIKYWIERLIRV